MEVSWPDDASAVTRSAMACSRVSCCVAAASVLLSLLAVPAPGTTVEELS